MTTRLLPTIRFLRFLLFSLLLTVPLAAQTNLAWDPGTTNTGTQVYTHPNNLAGQYQFRVVTEASVQGGWRTALRVTAGNANLYLRQGQQATTTEFDRSSTLAGSDGFVLAPNEYGAGQEWFIMVHVPASASWSLVTGEVFVQDLGTLPYTDSNSNTAYDIGEATAAGGPGALAIGAEGTRFFKADAPPGTPAWSLWLNGVAKDILVRKAQVPMGFGVDQTQEGRLLLVPPYLDTSTVFIAVNGSPGENINLDSRIQPVTNIAFGSTQAGVSFSGAPFRLYRTTVPPEQLGWDVSVTPTAGEADVAVRRNQAASERDNDAFSDVTGNSVDSVTLVPPGLTDGAWFITVYGGGAATFTLNNGSPVPVAINFTDTEVNPQPARVGWRYFALTDIPSQLGKLGWQLELSGHVAGTEIALRRGALPGRWSYRNGNFNGSTSHLDFSSTTGRLDRPGHQADVWYAGIYLGTGALGAFTLNTREIPAPVVPFNSGSSAVSNQHHTEWRWWRVDVPNTAGLLGWELKLANVTSGNPGVVVRRGSLPDSVSSAGWGFSASGFTTWPQGNMWTQQRDFTDRETDAGSPWRWRRMVIPMGRPLEPGTYYVGVGNTDGTAAMSYTLESRGIGTGFAIAVTNLGDAGTASSQATGNLAPRETRYYKATVPAGLRSWELVLTPTLGDMTLTVRRGTLPAPEIYDNVDNLSGKHMTKDGKERWVLLPRNNQDFLDTGDYYIAVASEGQNPVSSDIGTGNAAGTLSNNSQLPVTDLGTANAAGVSTAVSLEGGQIKAFRVLAPAGTIAMEARLDLRTGLPGVALASGIRFPVPNNNTSYGFDFGQSSDSTNHPSLVVIPNAPSGEYRILVSSFYDTSFFSYPDSTATLVVTARPASVVTFNGGASAVTNHQPNGWRFFRVDVPAGVHGWDLTPANITGLAVDQMTPEIVVRRDLMPTTVSTTFNFGNYALEWPSGNFWTQQLDFTWRNLEQNGSRRLYADFTAAMGRPLEPGTYYAGVFNPGNDPVSYTFESRGIGTGQALPLTTVAFAGGSIVTPALPARRAAFYKVTVPANTPSWEIRLEPSAGEMALRLRHGTIPDPDGGDVLSGGGQRITKPDGERFVVLPSQGQQFLTPGDYYLAVVSEGVSPPNGATPGTGTSTGTLTSLGALAVTNLGTATAVPTNTPVSLLSAQIKAYQITVPAGATSLDVLLDTLTGNPRLSGVSGVSPPRAAGLDYGFYGGQDPQGSSNEFHITSPAAGVWTFVIGADDDFFSGTYPDATGTLHISIAAGPQPLTFNGGSASVTGHAESTWKFWEVTVPAGVLGWDLRIVNVTAGRPQIVVRRGQLPESLSTGGFPASFDAWPVGASRVASADMNHRATEPDGRYAYGQFMVNAMGYPLEPGTYFVGVTNDPVAPQEMGYTIESRGIGNGQVIPVTNLALNGAQPVAATPARMAKLFKVTIPASTPSWELTLVPTAGDLCMVVRKDVVPDAMSTGSVYDGGGRFQQQADGERFLLLPPEPQAFLTPGDYYIAAVSEGVNPGVPSADYIGTGNSSGTIASSSPLPVTNLGTATAAGGTTAVSLVSGQLKAFQFTVPAGAPGLEIRLDNRVGSPVMHVRSDAVIPGAFYYASQGGGSSTTNAQVVSVAAPPAGTWSLSLETQDGFNLPAPASADLVVRVLQPQRLNFSSTENGNGFSHTHSRALLNGQRQFYEVQVPATVSGQAILGWWLKLDSTMTSIHLRIRETADFSSNDYTAANFGEDLVMATPYFQPARTWYLEVVGSGNGSYTLTSQPATLNLPAFTMPVTPGTTFADTGNGLPGDQGRDLADDAWHFYAFDVPAGNGGLLRAELTALNGNPDLFLRAGGIPTQHHDSNGPPNGGESLVHNALNDTGTQYGNWSPANGRFERELAPGRWYAAVRAASASNARYRLQLSTGTVQTLALNGGSVTLQNLAPADVRYYRFTVPLDAPNNWNLTFNETIGDVRVFVRDTIPPGNTAFISNFSLTDLTHWSSDNKNQGPYPRFDASGAYTLTTPPLRPAHTYYVGVQALDAAQFSLSSSTSGGTVGVLPVIAFYTGVINANLAAGERRRYRVPVPVGALRWIHTATHHPGVRVLIEQGTLPIESSQHYISSGADSSLNRSLVTSGWPWLAGHDYYLLLANDSGAAQNVVLTMDGRDATTEDEDHDGLADPWEVQFFGHTGFHGGHDVDGDGINNDMEYALGHDPTRDTSRLLPSAIITNPPNRRLALDILVQGTIPPQVRLEVFGVNSVGAAGTLIASRPPGGAWSGLVTNIPGGVRVSDTQLFDATPRRFLQLTATLVPEP